MSQDEVSGLQTWINERVLVEWLDRKSNTSSTLGNLSPVNSQSTFTFKFELDGARKQAYIRFSLTVTLKLSGHYRKRNLYLFLPVTSTPTFDFDVMKICDIGPAASHAYEAGLSDSGFILCACFSLKKPALLVAPKMRAAITPRSHFGRNLLRRHTSLSRALRFSVYIRPSDYAREGLKVARECLYGNSVKQFPIDFAKLYDGQDAQVLEADPSSPEPESTHEMDPPPQYEEPQIPRLQPAAQFPPSIPPTPRMPTASPSPEVLVPRSSSRSLRDAVSPRPRDSFVVSDSAAESVSSDCAAGIEKQGRANPDEERRRFLPSQQDQPNAKRHTGTSTDYVPDFLLDISSWGAKALAVNSAVYEHRRVEPCLRMLARYARVGDRVAFYDARAVCSAMFFFDPYDENDGSDYMEVAAEYLEDLERFLKWIIRQNHVADIAIWDYLILLGQAARAAAKRGVKLGVQAAEDAEYFKQKGRCMAWVLGVFT